jgi:hypothetical protein
MVNRIIGEYSGVGKAQLVAVEELVCDLAEGANSLVAHVGEAVESSFQFAPALLLDS